VPRNKTLDFMRAAAIVMMVAFHIIFDLTFFGYINTEIPTGSGWREWRALIVSLFLLSVGASLVFSFSDKLAIKKYLNRLLLLSIASLVVTMSSLIMTPESWIYFGVLHFITVATLILTWVRRCPNLCVISGIIVLVAFFGEFVPLNWSFSLFKEHLPSYTQDLVSPFPWLALPLFGIWLAHQSWFRQDPLRRIKLPDVMAGSSRHSLLIYLLHQPILFASLYLLGLIIHLSE